jgi:hypothetical protein
MRVLGTDLTISLVFFAIGVNFWSSIESFSWSCYFGVRSAIIGAWISDLTSM